MPPRGRRRSRAKGSNSNNELVPAAAPDEAPTSTEGGATDSTKVAMFCFCVAAIYGAYITQGVLQEKISTTKYGTEQERFEQLTFLNLTQCFVCFVWSFIMLKIWPGEPGTEAPILAYWACSISNAIGPACGMLALKYISYPAQVLAKSSKMIPGIMAVMLIGALIYGVQYSMQEYMCTFMVAGGVSLFAMKSSGKPGKIASPNAPLGYTLCLLNLGLDGFTNATQDALTARYPKVNAWHLMMGMNLWGTMYMALFMFVIPGGGGYDAVGFCSRHPDAAWDIFLFCLCGAVGQNFIFLTISRFGALTNTTITTTRKFVSILVSSLYNGNPLSQQQWGGVFMVFVGLTYQIWVKYQKKKERSAGGAAAATEVDNSNPSSPARSPRSPRSPASSRSRSRGKRSRKH